MTKHYTRTRTHPGEVLKEEFMKPYNLSANALALALHVSPNRISEIVRERRSITGDTAIRLALFFNTTSSFWMNLQSANDLSKAEVKSFEKVKKEILPVSLSA
ncbi:MAG: HigA family addiction module antidote protein [Proteobacteria bacterium]|nr:HigA family addiction module antidote protein [Pseudomonadota bacterium]